MKKLLIAAAGLVALTAPALAADMAPRPYTKAPPPILAAMYDWSGFYIGLNGGGGSSHKCWDIIDSITPFTPGASQGCHDATGGTVGGQVGYRWQSQAWVFGVEAQGNWANFRGSNVNTQFQVTDNTKINAFGLFTGQVGYSFNNVLLYAKGGAAVVQDKYFTVSTFNNAGFGLIVDTASETRWGGVVGVGAEIGFARNWSVAFEYDHMFMGTHNVNAYSIGNVNGAAGAFSATDRIRQDVDMATVRVNYRWGGPVVARY